MENYNWPEITEDTTMEELQAIHKRIWQYVVENGGKPNTPYHNDCVACEYNGLFYFDEQFIRCDHCPIDWGEDRPCCAGSLYARWFGSIDPIGASFLAKQIRDIPFKGGSENV